MLALSLPSPYLSGARDDPDASLWQSLLGPPEAALAELAALGVKAIELADVRGHVDPAAVTRSLLLVQDAGLEPHAHLWIPRGFDPVRPPVALIAVVTAFERRAQGLAAARCAACAVHGHRRNDPGALVSSVRDLRALNAWLTTHGACAALEVCRFRSEGPLGGTYAEVVEMARAAGPEVGITWDLGHTTWNHQQGLDRLWPGPAFLERVAHVHVHDVGANGRTHFPLDQARAALEGFVERLKGVGYSGLWDLEVYPERWGGSTSEKRRRLEASLVRLARATA